MRRPNLNDESNQTSSEAVRDPLDDMIGISPAIKQVKALIRQVAPSDITVLISGESGTGKELVARAVHHHSPRRKGPLVSPNCGAIPEGIFESEIFGHEKGSFTSADQQRKGYFEMANRGTLFLDEIGEMPLQVQVKMLRVLETGSFLRVGGTVEVKVNVRVIAATNKDLSVEVSQGRFRQDLYYRLKAVNISLQPLREQIEDIPLLTEYFAREFAVRNHRPIPLIDPEVPRILQGQYWAGNVRELKNFVESLIALGQDEIISPEIVRVRLGSERGNPNLPVIVGRSDADLNQELIYRTLLELKHDMNSIKGLLQQVIQQQPSEIQYKFKGAEEIKDYSLDEVERDQIERAIDNFNGRKAAKALGIGERTLYRKIKQYDIK